MRESYALSESQLEALNNGESVRIPGQFSGNITVNPPCDGDHDWHAFDYRGNDNELHRRCKQCNEKEVIRIQEDELWNAVVNSEHVMETQ